MDEAANIVVTTLAVDSVLAEEPMAMDVEVLCGGGGELEEMEVGIATEVNVDDDPE